MFHVPFNIQRDCTYSIFRSTCAEEGIICLHSWIEIYGLIRVPPNGRMDGVLDRLGHSKSLKKNYPNRSIIDLISSALNERIEVDRKKFVNRSFFLAIFLHPGQTNDIVSGIVDTQLHANTFLRRPWDYSLLRSLWTILDERLLLSITWTNENGYLELSRIYLSNIHEDILFQIILSISKAGEGEKKRAYNILFPRNLMELRWIRI